MTEPFLQQEVNAVVPSARGLSFRAAETGAPMVLIQAGTTVATQRPRSTDSLAVL